MNRTMIRTQTRSATASAGTHTKAEAHLRRVSRMAAVAVLTLLASTAPLLAGPLTPPFGPVNSTMKTMTEVEPRIAVNSVNTPGNSMFTFRITQPGSYYLTRNLDQLLFAPGGIEITASNVTLDLNGFSVHSPIENSSVGIQSSGGVGVTVKNGVVSDWGTSGIVLGAGSTVQNVTVEGVGGPYGISIFSGVVDSCVVFASRGVGIQAANGGVIRNCSVQLCVGNGIESGANSRVENSVSIDNSGFGISVIASTVTGCTVSGNQLSGIRSIGSSTITECKSNSNDLDGYELSTQDVITGSTADRNRGNGISAQSRCRIEDNTCIENGFGSFTGAGILLETGGSRNIVKNNTAIASDWGIKVDSTLNLILGNGASNNTTNFTIAPGNRVTTIVNLSTNAALINGNTGGASSTDADANYVY